MKEWIKTEGKPPACEDSMYWVFVEGEVKMCYLNDYSSFGGFSEDCWQTLSGDDFDFGGTMYIQVERPAPPF